MDQVQFVDHIPWNFLKAVFHKFYLVHSWILFPISCTPYLNHVLNRHNILAKWNNFTSSLVQDLASTQKMLWWRLEVYLKPCQRFKMEVEKINTWFHSFSIFAKSSIIDVWHGLKHTSEGLLKLYVKTQSLEVFWK